MLSTLAEHHGFGNAGTPRQSLNLLIIAVDYVSQEVVCLLGRLLHILVAVCI